MKNLFDVVQLALSFSGPLGVMLRAVGLLVLLYCVLFALRILGAVARRLPELNFVFWFYAAALVVLVEIARYPIADSLQLLEPAVYETEYSGLSDDARTAAFERALKSKVGPAEFNVIQQATNQTAQKLGVKPCDIYAVAASECGLNPFAKNVIRGRTVAAGWIQFTRVGCGFVPGLEHEQVLGACEARDVAAMMNWTDAYLCNTANGRPLRGALDVYLCVFAPAAVGKPDDFVLYEGWNSKAYQQNAGLDGWTERSTGRIVRLLSKCNGEITVGELRLRMEYKAAQIINAQ